jgi:hypothetical protein
MRTGFLIPLTARGPSGPSKTNFLWKQDNIYVMDNHRLALWCFGQHLKNHGKFNLFHLDAHYDCDPVAVSEWQEQKLDLEKLSLDEFLNLKNKAGKDLVLWDNYLPIFLTEYKERLKERVAATHHIGLKGDFTTELETYDLLKPLDDLLLFSRPWIINIDLDYFFPRHDKSTTLFHPDYIRKFFKLVKLNYDEGRIAVLTVCLSPECCGGWKEAESVHKDSPN